MEMLIMYCLSMSWPMSSYLQYFIYLFNLIVATSIPYGHYSFETNSTQWSNDSISRSINVANEELILSQDVTELFTWEQFTNVSTYY